MARTGDMAQQRELLPEEGTPGVMEDARAASTSNESITPDKIISNPTSSSSKDGRVPSSSRGFATSTVTSSGKGSQVNSESIESLKVETTTKAESDSDNSSDSDQVAEDEVSQGACVDAVDLEGNNGIFLATYIGRSRKECDFTTINGKGQTVLHLAAEIGNTEALEYFISTGADVNHRSFDGETPLHRVTLAKENFVETLKILKKNGADMNAVDEEGNNLIHTAILMKRSKEDLESILQVGCDWRMKTKCEYSVLHLAAHVGHVEAVQYFISLGAEVNAKDDFERTPLIQVVSANENFLETVTALVSNGAQINAVDNNGNNLVMMATVAGRTVEELKHLVDLGGDWKATNKLGQTVLDAALQTRNSDTFNYFASMGASMYVYDALGNSVELKPTNMYTYYF